MKATQVFPGSFSFCDRDRKAFEEFGACDKIAKRCTELVSLDSLPLTNNEKLSFVAGFLLSFHMKLDKTFHVVHK